jgi:glutaredoxin
MADYRPVLFHSQLSTDCLRIKRTIRELKVDVDIRSILVSRRHREELRGIAGSLRVPCLVVAESVVQGVEEIEKYLHLRYGIRD